MDNKINQNIKSNLNSNHLNINQKNKTKTGYIQNFKNNIKIFLNDTFFSSDISLLLSIIFIFIFISIMSLISFENLSLIRYSFFNNAIAILFSIIIIYIVFNFMGERTKILGINIDLGYIFYALSICGLFILFSG
jgi:hypothetical protein